MAWLRRARDYPFFDNAGLPIAFAHRGGALTPGNAGIENSMRAFQTAIDLGYRYVETDVHATADGVVIAFHDRTLDRVTDLTGAIADVPYERVRRARIGGREPVALLSEMLSSWPQLRLNIDCKALGAVEPLCRVIADQRAEDRVCVASFSSRRLRLLRVRLGPRVATSYAMPGVTALALLPSGVLRSARVGRRGVAAQVPAAIAGVPFVRAPFVMRAHALGKLVHVWTVDEPTQMHQLLDLGVDGLMTDRADLLRDVLTARNAWRG